MAFLHTDLLFEPLHWCGSVSALNTSCGLGHQHAGGGCSSVSSRDPSWHPFLGHPFLCMNPMEDGKCPLKPEWDFLDHDQASLANANLYFQLGWTNVKIRYSLYFQLTVNIRKQLACLAPCIESVANRDCMEINELYKIALTVLTMNTENTATPATSGKPDEQATLAFPILKKLISSREGSQPLVPAEGIFSFTYFPQPLLLVSPQIPPLSAAKTRREDKTILCAQTPEIIFFRKLLWIANTWLRIFKSRRAGWVIWSPTGIWVASVVIISFICT